MSIAAVLNIQLRAQTDQLRAGFQKTEAAIGNLNKRMSRNVAVGMAKFTAGMLAIKGSVIAVRAAFASLNDSISSMDRMAKSASALGIAADSLAELGFAAEQSGASQATLTKGLQQLANRVADAAAGIGDGKKALDELGLSADSLMRLPVDQQFRKIADAMRNTNNHTQQVQLAMDLFGRSGVELINVLDQGSDGLDRFARRAKELGIDLGESRGEIEQLTDAVNEASHAWKGFKNRVTIALAPIVRNTLSAASDIVASLTNQRHAFEKLFGAHSYHLVKPSAAVMARQEAAVKAIKKQNDELKEAGKRLTERMRTPLEKAKLDIANFQKYLDSGAINLETFRRATVKTIQSLMSSHRELQSIPSIGAVTKSSAAGFSALQKAQRDADHQRRLAEERNRVLSRILAAVERGDVVLAPMEI